LRHSIGNWGIERLTIAEITIVDSAEPQSSIVIHQIPKIANAAIINGMPQSPIAGSSINHQSSITDRQWTRRQTSAASLAQQFT
jgi:hypothetical protein